MSIQQQNQIDALKAKLETHAALFVELARDVADLKEQVAELTRLLQAMTRASAGKDKAA